MEAVDEVSLAAGHQVKERGGIALQGDHTDRLLDLNVHDDHL